MKRTELRRKTPLVTRAPLVTRTPLSRRCALSPVSDKRRRDNVERVRVVNGMRLAAQGRCARCGRRDQPVHGHERVRRSQGSDITRPDCLLCNCCNGWAASEPKAAAWTGWLITPKWRHDPALENGEAWDLDGNRVRFETLYEESV